MAIILDQICKSYQEGGASRSILSGISVEITMGCFSVVLGKSGSGKSTLLNLIGGIDTPDSGSIVFGNKNISILSDYERTIFRRREIGFVFQFFNLIPTLTVLENTLLIAELDGFVGQQQREAAENMLTRVGLSDRMQTMPDKLSGGEQQRVAIARALAHDPEVILADEPTGNLDHETGKEVLDLMLQLIQEKGKTLIMATHSDDALSAADHIYRIEKGLLHSVSSD